MPGRSGPPPSRELPEILQRGIALFNAEEYFEAHEAFEELWRAASGDRRQLYQGLVQACAGMVKHQRGQPLSARTLLDKGVRKLRDAPVGCLPAIRLDALISDLEAVRAALEAGGAVTRPAMKRAGGI